MPSGKPEVSHLDEPSRPSQPRDMSDPNEVFSVKILEEATFDETYEHPTMVAGPCSMVPLKALGKARGLPLESSPSLQYFTHSPCRKLA